MILKHRCGRYHRLSPCQSHGVGFLIRLAGVSPILSPSATIVVIVTPAVINIIIIIILAGVSAVVRTTVDDVAIATVANLCHFSLHRQSADEGLGHEQCQECNRSPKNEGENLKMMMVMMMMVMMVIVG